MEDYVKTLKDNDLKVTAPRLQIMKYLDRNRTHPTASKIYTDLKKKNPSLSRTTVYNTLEVLHEYGIIQNLSITESEMRYDFKTIMHHHFLCKRCGSIIDLHHSCKYMDSQINGEHRVEEVHGYFKGICKDCLMKENR